MSYELYWHGDPEAVRPYREADRLSMRRADRLAWVQGRYVYDAMGAMAPLFRTFSKRGARKYVEKPYMELADDEARQQTREQQLENGRLVAMEIARRIGRWERDQGEGEDG